MPTDTEQSQRKRRAPAAETPTPTPPAPPPAPTPTPAPDPPDVTPQPPTPTPAPPPPPVQSHSEQRPFGHLTEQERGFPFSAPPKLIDELTRDERVAWEQSIQDTPHAVERRLFNEHHGHHRGCPEQKNRWIGRVEAYEVTDPRGAEVLIIRCGVCGGHARADQLTDD